MEVYVKAVKAAVGVLVLGTLTLTLTLTLALAPSGCWYWASQCGPIENSPGPGWA